MKSIIIISHKNPDTDAVVSSLVFAGFLKKIKKPILGFLGFKIKVGISGNLNKEAKFILDYFKQKKPTLIKSVRGKNVFFIDHGDYEQAANGAREANVIGVLDHHKLGGLKTIVPIFYRAEPIGSTSTIVAKMFLENNLSLDKKMAGLLLAGVLSDTLKFTSPTTTTEDKKIALILSKISKENINKLSKKIFKAKSDIGDLSVDELIAMDYKEFKAGRVNFAIGVWETTYPKKIKEIKKELLFALEKLKKKRKMELMFFALIDIFAKSSTIFLLGERERQIAERVFKKKVKQNLLFLPGVLSRKKQILPPILEFLEKK